MSSKITKTLSLETDPKNIGAFIGSNGKNVRNIIKKSKLKILDKKDISKEDWESVLIDINFDKTETNIESKITCNEENYDIIQGILLDYVIFHNKQMKILEKKKSNGVKIIYRVGAQHKFIPKMIGVSGCNISKLKKDIWKTGLNCVPKIIIEEPTRFYSKIRNIGDKNCEEKIMIIIMHIKGNVILENIDKIVNEYVNIFTEEKDTEESSNGGW